MREAWIGAVVMFVIGSAGSVEAGTIDLRNYPNPSYQGAWGQPSSLLYAQSIVADDVLLSEVRMLGRAMEISDIQFNILVTGTRSAGGGLGLLPSMGDIRYNSGQLTIPLNAGFVERTVYPNVSVSVGETVFLVFDTFSYPSSGRGQMLGTTYRGGIDRYPPGEFVYCDYTGASLQAFDSLPWEHRSADKQDLAILAAFVPEPATLSLLALGGLAFLRRKRGRRV